MRLRLILSFVFVVLVSVIIVVVIARQRTASEVQAFMFRGAMTDADSIATDLEEFYQEKGGWAGIETFFQRYAQPGGMGVGPGSIKAGMMRARLRLSDRSGNVIADTDTSGVGDVFTRIERQAAKPLRANLRLAGYLLVEGGMGYTQAEQLFLVNRLNQAALRTALIAGGLSLLLALLLSLSLLRPVRALTQAADQMARGDLSQRVEVRGEDELAKLGRAFNEMADSLQEAENVRRSMTADIAHELRTPLAVQRAHLEALQDGIYPLISQNLQPILEQNLLLSRLVDDLRTLALADAGQLQLERAATDLVSMLSRTLERFQPQALSRQVHLAFTAPASGEIPLIIVDPLRIEQILGNLLSNALRITPEGGQIELSVAYANRQVTVQVHDSGSGIPPEALEHIFDRFYRADRARSRAEGGSGLGLAIARQLAEMHAGSLTAANHPTGGAVFTLSLPVPSA